MKDDFDEIIGYENVKKRLRMISDMLKMPEGYRQPNGLMPSGILFEGWPGVGKTTMARCLIASSGRKYFSCIIKGSQEEFLDSIRNTFKEAEKAAPSIVFIDDLDEFVDDFDEMVDDLDKFVPADQSHPDADAFVTLQSCMDDVKGKDVFVIATAWESYKLPVSLFRHGRLEEIIHLTLPEGQDRVHIFSHYLSASGLTENINPVLLANLLDGESCGTIKNTVERACEKAVSHHQKKISTHDLIEAYVDERIGYNGCKIPPYPIEEVIRGAYHESAHAVVSEVLRPGSVVLMTVKPAGFGHLGFTKRKIDHAGQKTFSDYEWNIKTALAGEAADELFPGYRDRGVSSDRDYFPLRLDALIDAVCDYDLQNHEFTREFKINGKNKNSLIYALISSCYKEVKQILASHRKQVDRIAEKLAQKETLFYPEIRKIMTGF